MDVPTCDLFATSDSGCCAAMCTQALAELLRGVVKVLPLRAYAATLEFNPYLGRQIVPMALKILDNFVLGIAGLRFHHRIQELTPHGRSATSRSGFRIARGHHGHGHLTPRNAHSPNTLAWPLPKRRDGHHKKALLTTAQQEGEITTHVSNHRHRCLLRARRERPRHRRAAERPDRLHSRTPIGMTEVACFAATTGGVECVTMTSTL